MIPQLDLFQPRVEFDPFDGIELDEESLALLGAATMAPSDPWGGLEQKLRLLGLRYYQREAVTSAINMWNQPEMPPQRILIEAATGTGKTQMFCALAAVVEERVLFMAHRKELVFQIVDRLRAMTGEYPGVEMADEHAPLNARLVVASTDTIKSPARLSGFPKNHFKYIVADEAHHYVARTYRRPLDHFDAALTLGVTATPDRSDKQALGQLFDDVAYVFGIVDAIDAGYLVPVRGNAGALGEINLDGMKLVRGDFVDAELDERIAGMVEGVVQNMLDKCGTRQCVAFFPKVRSAQLAAERLNVLRPGCAGFIHGGTPPDERDSVVRDFRNGTIQFLCNCQIATEGFDVPSASVIAMARPTKSRSLYAQCAGRGTRVLPGLIDHLDGPENAAARRAIIENSRKPYCEILDFVGVGQHSLVGPEDILGGRFTDTEIARAKVLAKKQGGRNTLDYLRQAQAEIRAYAASMQAASDVKVPFREFDPFRALGVKLTDDSRYAPYSGPVTAKQKDCLRNLGFTDTEVAGLNKRAFGQILRAVQQRREKGLCTFKQMKILAKHGISEKNVTFSAAGAAMDYLSHNHWGKGKSFDPNHLNRIVKGIL